MKEQTKNNKQSIERSEIFLKLDSRVIEFEIKKTVFGYRVRKYVNDFTKPIKEEPKAFLKLFGIDPEEIEFKVSKDKNKRVFFGFLKAGRAATLGINFKIVISEIFQHDTNTISYALDANISRKVEREISDFVKTLFDKPNPDEKPKEEKNKKAKRVKQ